MTRKYLLSTLVGLAFVTGCGDDTATPQDTDTDGTGTGTMTSMTSMSTTTPTTTESTTDMTATDPTATDTGVDSSTTEMAESSSSSSGEVIPPDPVDFMVRIENISDQTPVPTPFSPGVWVEHTLGSQPVFTTNMAAPDNGIVALAEDGDPTALDAAMDSVAEVVQHGIFDTPVEGTGPVILPGEAYEFTIEQAMPGSRLSLFTMLVNSNDTFLGTGPNGVSLFLPSGQPQAEDDIAPVMEYWDAGSEANQPPGGGSNQAPNQAAANTGPDETGVVSLRGESTHQVPLASKLVSVNVIEDMKTGVLTFQISNISDDDGGFVSPFSPVVWALHDESTTLFELGGSAGDTAGLEGLAEDGASATLLATLGGMAGVGDSGVTPTGVAPGETVEFTVDPDTNNRFLTFASMVVWTNDGFLSTPVGIEIADNTGMPRSTAAIEADFERLLSVFDAGTEENESCGITGPNNAENQTFPGTGSPDPDNSIRYYFDPTNDFADINDIIEVELMQGFGVDEFDLTITNTSLNMPFEGLLTPVVWAVHDGSFSAFDAGMPASIGIEELAEDGLTAMLEAEISAAGITNFGVIGGPLGPGASSSTITISTTDAEPYLSLWTMVVPTNDTFASLGGQGINLYNGTTPISNQDLALAVADALALWDAGTEGNQACGGGAAMPIIGAPETVGPSEGNGILRQAEDNATWAFPFPDQMVRVIVTPL